ncbi:anti-sigma factor domain-containing protein [Saccharococcus thermophilus]|uniref:anti-sigma factor domain-containing protein n=1 Tax=Saccharococcus thermophilus TaxID=29396 RepID=UPI003624EE85
MKKGIVLELDEEFVTLLTPEGEFIQVKEDEYEIGEEIEARLVKKPYVRRRSFRYAAVSLIAAAVLFIATLLHLPSDEVYAYMSIDINPSIEVGVDDQLNVLTLKAYNEEGKKIVSQLSNWKKVAFVDIATEIIELSRKQGYLQKGGQVLITTVEKKHLAASSRKLSEELSEIQHSYQQKNIIVKMEKSTMEVRNKALKKGMTTGKLLQMEQQMKEVSPKEPKAKKLQKPLKQNDGDKKNEQQMNNHSLNEKNKNSGRENNEQQTNNDLLNEKDEQNHKKKKNNGNEKNEINHSLQKEDKRKREENNNEQKEMQKNYYPSEERDEQDQKKSDNKKLNKNRENYKLFTENSKYHNSHRSHDHYWKRHQKKNNKQDEHHGKQNYDKDSRKSFEHDDDENDHEKENKQIHEYVH